MSDVPNEIRIFSRNMVTPTGLIAGEIVCQDGFIHAVEPRNAASRSAVDWEHDVVVPGLVDIHTDNLEKHFQPRPGALWDAVGAAIAHDAQCAGAGITTVFDSLSLHGRKEGLDRKDALAPMIAGMDTAAAEGLLRAEHLLHLRCEVTNPDLLDLLNPHLDNPRLRLLSVMDHTPGQRQTTNIDRLRENLAADGKGAKEIADSLAEQTAWRDQSAAPRNRASVFSVARKLGIPLASHDDATNDHVDEAHANGAIIAEFPVSMVAALRSRAVGMKVFMGGPNFVRGGSHSGNLSARDCANVGVLDGITSDYIPLSMLRSAFMLADPPFNWPIQDAIATVARTPALACGLTDRGEIAEGQRADFLRIRRSTQGWPAPREVWRLGQRVA